MPTFAIIARDAPGAIPLRLATRPRHLDHVRSIGARVLRAGPIEDEAGQPMGSIILAEFDDRAAAHAFADADPYARAGVFAQVEVLAWRSVFPEPG